MSDPRHPYARSINEASMHFLRPQVDCVVCVIPDAEGATRTCLSLDEAQWFFQKYGVTA